MTGKERVRPGERGHRRWGRIRGGEAGSGGGISLVMLIGAIGLLMVLGLVMDGSARARALDRADQLASEAARAGLQAATPDESAAICRHTASPSTTARSPGSS